MAYLESFSLDWHFHHMLSLQIENNRIQEDMTTVLSENNQLRGEITDLEAGKVELEKRHEMDVTECQLLKEKIKKLEEDVSRLEVDNKKLSKKSHEGLRHNRWVHKQWYKTKQELDEYLRREADRYHGRH